MINLIYSKLDDGILLSIFLENYDIFKNQRKLIVERLLLALEINIYNKEYEIITWEQFFRFKKILVIKDTSNYELVCFVIKVANFWENLIN